MRKAALLPANPLKQMTPLTTNSTYDDLTLFGVRALLQLLCTQLAGLFKSGKPSFSRCSTYNCATLRAKCRILAM